MQALHFDDDMGYGFPKWGREGLRSVRGHPMKRVISLVTVLSLAFSLFAFPAMSYADGEQSLHPVAKLVNDPTASVVTDSASTSSLLPLNQGALRIDSSTIADDGAMKAIGGVVDISLSTQISSQKGSNLKASIVHEGQGKYDSYTTVPVTLAKKDSAGAVDEYYARIKDVDAGSHKLHVYGADYQEFWQDIEVNDGDRVVVTLVDTAMNEAVYIERMKMGLIPYGDFDGNGSVTSLDSEAIASAVNRNYGIDEPTLEDMANYDLSGSHAIELDDVQTLAMNMDRASESGQLRYTKDPSFIKTDATKLNLVGDSTITDMFIDNGAVTTLAPGDATKEISTVNPVEFEVTPASNTEMAGMVIVVPKDSDGRPTQGTILVETDDGEVLPIDFKDPGITTRNMVRSSMPMVMRAASRATTPQPTYDATSGQITIDFGNQIAVKKITIRITQTASNKLADIAHVEFLNGMEDKIPDPQLDIPTNIIATPADKKFSLTWNPCTNISGYQVEVSASNAKNVFTTTVPSLQVENLGSKKLKNDTEYSVRVRSMSESDNWFSPWSNPVKVTPIASNAPTVPENITLTASFNDITVSWKEAEDAQTYNVFWSEDQRNWNEVRNITGTRHNIGGLKSNIGYYVQVSATNQNGDSGKSAPRYVVTQTSNVKVPWYKMINRTAQGLATGREFDDGITSVTKGAGENDFDKNPGFKSEWDVVDGDYGTYWYNKGNSGGPQNGPIIEFDEEHEMDHFIMTTYLGAGYASFASIRIYIWDAQGNSVNYWGPYENPNLVNYTSVAGAANTIKVNFPKSKVKKIQVTAQRYYSAPDSTIAELAFYDYDDLKDKVANLWADSMHTTLRDDVTQQTIDDIRAQLETEDPVCGEKTPDYSYYDLQLKNAQTVLDHGDLRTALTFDSSVDKSVNNYAGGTNAWQPLGVSGKAGDTINIYVGASNRQDGVSGVGTALALYVGQQHPVSSRPVFTLSDPTLTGPNQNNHSLKTGLNTITVPGGYSQEAEDGGALYVEYISSTKSYEYSVRVEGGTEIPRLDLHGITDENERYEKALDYVNALEPHVAGLKAYHDANHNDVMDGEYGQGQSCTANMTDIAIDYLMYSLPASQVWNQISAQAAANNEDRARRLLQALDGADDAMILFYQHKGLSNLANAEGDSTNYGANGLPKSRQNVRYTQMFAGAFMYASGNHIGIEWGSVGGPVSLDGVQTDADGRYQSGRYFGWGLNHEIGHEINQGQYAIAEVTNNYYAQLAQSHDSTDTTRWGDYDNVYRKVTSGAKGAAGGKTGIAMYWQLHLAYDGMDMLSNTGKKSFNYKTYDNYTDLFNNLIFARIDSYARNQSLAPSPGGVSLSLAGADKDNAIIRLACAATQKDLRDYFIAWGLTPDEATDAYASQFDKEERGIQYVTDEARVYQMENYSASSASAKPSAPSSINVDYTSGSNSVTIDLSGCPTGSDILGYEILRNGQAVGFVKAGTTSFIDTINTINNRVFTYQLRVVNNWLNRSDVVTASPIKVHHDNLLDKSKWSLKTDLRDSSNTSEGEFTDDERENTLDWTSSTITNGKDTIIGCDGEPDMTKLSANAAIDDDASTVFEGTLTGDSSSNDASITINFGQNVEMTAVRYNAKGGASPISDYSIEISNDGVNFTTLRTGTFNLVDGVDTVFFDEGGKENRLLIYDASYMRITATSQQRISVAELDVLGPTGDDVNIMDGGIGVLRSDTNVGTNSAGEPEIIPAGSFIVTGTYQGNPAYNVVVLYDNDKLKLDSARPQTDAIIEGSQIVFGEKPLGDEMLPDVRVGYWAYYVTPEDMQRYEEETGNAWVAPKSVSAELYRVDDAITLEGQRMVANALPVDVPATLPDVELSFGTVSSASLLNDLSLDEIVGRNSSDEGAGQEESYPDEDSDDGDDSNETVNLPQDNSASFRDEDDVSQTDTVSDDDPQV